MTSILQNAELLSPKEKDKLNAFEEYVKNYELEKDHFQNLIDWMFLNYSP